jgi:hypothetical protein
MRLGDRVQLADGSTGVVGAMSGTDQTCLVKREGTYRVSLGLLTDWLPVDSVQVIVPPMVVEDEDTFPTE